MVGNGPIAPAMALGSSSPAPTMNPQVGITIAQHTSYRSGKTEVQEYLEQSGMLEEFTAKLRMDIVDENADEGRLIEGIRHLTSAGASTAAQG